MFALHPSECVEHPDEDLGVLEEDPGEYSELEELRCVCLGMLEVFGPHPYERGAMPDANREAHSAMRTAPRRVGSDALIERMDALPEGRDAPPVPRDAAPVPCDAQPVPCDAPPISRDAPCIRSDAVRKRRRHSRRVTRSSRVSLDTLPSVDHAAAEPRTCRPVPRERERVRRELAGARDDAPRTRRDAERLPRDALRARRDAERGRHEARRDAIVVNGEN
jgi:hypothetical protein